MAATMTATEGTQQSVLAQLQAASTALTAISGYVDGLEGNTDGIEGKLDTLHTDLAAVATQTTAAAILAKLSSDPATQTTLAAVLAKLSSDPATQTTLAALLASTGATGDASSATTHTGLLKAIKASLASTLLVGTSTLAAASNPGSVVATGTASAQLVASNAARRYLVLYNTGTSDVWVSLGAAAVVGQGIRLPAGGGWEMPASALYTGALNAIGAAASTVAVTEY